MNRVARFFYTKLPLNYQMAIEYPNIFNSKALLGNLGLKIYHLATLIKNLQQFALNESDAYFKANVSPTARRHGAMVHKSD
jgi:hypothetical protein